MNRFSRNSESNESPRRRLRLFAMNDRTRKEQSSPVTAKCEVQSPKKTSSNESPHKSSNNQYLRQAPLSPSKKAPLLPRTSLTAPAPLLTQQHKDPPSPSSPRSVLPPAPAMEQRERTPTPPAARRETVDCATRPGVSFQPNPTPINDVDNLDPIAAKLSTYGRPGPSQHQQPPNPSMTMMDPIAAKIAAHDNNSRHSNPPSRSFANDPLVPPPSHYHHDQHHHHQYMEIAPGQHVRLRGAKETWQCVENDAYLPTTCFSCDTDLCCIMDASYVLCPLCKVVSPVEGWAGGPDGGVGLGFTYQDLAMWQQEIIERRNQQQAVY
mmetsp:Transcript_12037/g.23122  ORF Transcript_12037/g.23122 Transcript_12037/m.23122 type:complete len:323 (-) Transcript_12037:22-990(-)|eukprot:scaffold1112_cov92-Amphora_coffeaeformis.AAC.23